MIMDDPAFSNQSLVLLLLVIVAIEKTLKVQLLHEVQAS